LEIKKRGRPQKKESEKIKYISGSFSVKLGQKLKIEEMAKKQGLTVSKLIIKKVLGED